ncbi:P-loop containing nucleoside triphosphate hydrolase protein [Schizophyllum commune H4-8]|uniref:P-loop containing nucleoside triphosphate hydrolase protein n=1 Tax=Schizophyllum commune (strain H4-8 / FGSC 9210) TaxID=578458 RepID=UPI00215DFE63|nr:P-loop containing nucleoside triphosphate hydrolase protein [Schizophyllum commune H4-8]KAI5889530.1 P-loop containing nucleoside triphosphate hydrolase protein [Schizophyllum commune H4-8]
MSDDVVQQVLSLLSQPTTTSSNGCAPNATAATGATPSHLPVNIPEGWQATLFPFLSLIRWFATLPDWLKLLIVGGIVETCRRTLSTLYERVLGAFFITATFEEDDDAYDWMLVWLSKQPSWSNAREVHITARSYGRDSGDDYLIPGEDPSSAGALLGKSTPLTYLPSPDSSYVFYYPADAPWYARRRVSVKRVQREAHGYRGGFDELLEMSILARSHKTLNRLLIDAKRTYAAERADKIEIHAANLDGSWHKVAYRPKRPLNSIVLEPGIKNLLVDDARDFLESRDWYADRGIPFRRGYLLYGAPGCGKTSMIHSMAGELGLDVYILSLSTAGMDDSKLSELISELPTECIALMEDIDAAFTRGIGARGKPDDDAEDESAKPAKDKPAENNNASISSRVSLSGLLNALDGVGAQEGRILFATTNHYDALDPALCRPGRMDVHVEFKLASKFQAGELFRHFYAPRHKRPEVEKIPDSGYVSAAASDAGEKSSPEPITHNGELHYRSRIFRIDAALADALAARFAEAIPEREFSMASLQGYLMKYKVNPQDAVDNVEDWVQAQQSATHGKGATQVLKVESADDS